MASPQKENGYTPIANEIVDRLGRIRLTTYEWQILMCLFRKTYGWNKPHDRISLDQFASYTEIRRPHVCRTLKKLLKKRVITQIGNGYHVRYSFQKNYESWKLLPKRVSLPKQVMRVTQIGNEMVPNQVPTKDNTKETITKDKYIVDFEDLWKAYPLKDGKKSAERSFRASVKTDKDLEDIKTAHANYLASDRVARGFVKNGSTWFNNWRDWINFKEEKKLEPWQINEMKKRGVSC